MFEMSPDRPLKALELTCKKVDNMPHSFFTRSLVNAIVPEDQVRQKPGVLFFENDGKFKAMAENQVLAEDLNAHEVIFFYLCIHHALNLLLPSVLVEKNRKLLDKFFSAK